MAASHPMFLAFVLRLEYLATFVAFEFVSHVELVSGRMNASERGNRLGF